MLLRPMLRGRYLGLLGLLLLTACSRGPSEQGILAAYQQEVTQTNTMTRQFGADLAPIVVNGVKKLKCSEFGNQGAYRCQVTIDSTLPMIGRTQTPTTLILRPKHTATQDVLWVIDRHADIDDH